jgi:hypothetical protein
MRSNLMLVIVATRHDQLAQSLVSRWEAYGTGLLTCTDLSTRGWRHTLNTTTSATAVVSGQVVPTEAITGVLTRIPCIFEQELVHIVREDRSYVATEMTAFLLSWLSRLPCPVLNVPTPSCLSGVFWRQEAWLRVAASMTIPCIRLQRSTRNMPEASLTDTTDTVAVTVVGDQCFGGVDGTLKKQARCLADAARVDLLTVHFQGAEAGACFVKADLWPDPTADGVHDAILAYLHREYAQNREWRR